MANNTKKYALQFQKEFIVAPGNKLYCNICACIVSSDHKSAILKHRSSKKHNNGLTETEFVMQTFLTEPVEDLTEKLVKAFLSADILLYTLFSRYKPHHVM